MRRGVMVALMAGIVCLSARAADLMQFVPKGGMRPPDGSRRIRVTTRRSERKLTLTVNSTVTPNRRSTDCPHAIAAQWLRAHLVATVAFASAFFVTMAVHGATFVNICNHTKQNIFATAVLRDLPTDQWLPTGSFTPVLPTKCARIIEGDYDMVGGREIYWYAVSEDNTLLWMTEGSPGKFCFLQDPNLPLTSSYELVDSRHPECTPAYLRSLNFAAVRRTGRHFSALVTLTEPVDVEAQRKRREEQDILWERDARERAERLRIRSQGSPNGARPTAPQANVYVVQRYSCLEGNRDAGDCTVQGNGNTCQAANEDLARKVRQMGGDPCKRCNGDITTYKRMGRVERIHDGPCRGQ